MGGDHVCNSCGAGGMEIFHEQRNVPVHSVLLMPLREEAVNYPKGDIALGFCRDCGFISNVMFDPRKHEYSSRYEETQGFSSTFTAFHRKLAGHLIDRYNLRGKYVVEIGCGKGEFLNLLCELGGNRGVGFDPAYVSDRDHGGTNGRTTFINDFYSEKYSGYKGDFIVCKMTLEHIHETSDFINTVRRSAGEDPATVVFFQVPDVTRVLHDCAFEDIYYEHCSYFSPGSLARLFRKCGFDVVDLYKDYDDQYLMIEARPHSGNADNMLLSENDMEILKRGVAHFAGKHLQKTVTWNRTLDEFRRNGRKVVLWGSGSKGVAFLTSLGVTDAVEYVVDINPYRQGFYMAGTGQEIVAPEFLKEYRPDSVIVMNSIYRDEISRMLQGMGLTANLIAL
ncbi:MAG: methyltransferase domain-containing protein [Nitrospiraceae bacterium]|nr:MAG: methyltransferase domain-containing protein [Nitrospiraceae bacterium]